jgi:long-chain acyl-CoA synthetase
LSEDGRAAAKRGGKAAMEKDLAEHLASVNVGLDHVEQLQFLSAVCEEWTAENGMLTPTLKIKRGRIEEAYAGQVAGWYAQGRKVVWAEPSASR